MNLEHTAINVPDVKAAAAWYAEQFDLAIVFRTESSPFMHFLADSNGSMIEMYSNPIADHFDFPEVNPYNLHFAFATEDIGADIARLKEAGATQVAEIEVTPRNDRLVFMRDPWGVPFQLVQRSTPLH